MLDEYTKRQFLDLLVKSNANYLGDCAYRVFGSLKHTNTSHVSQLFKDNLKRAIAGNVSKKWSQTHIASLILYKLYWGIVKCEPQRNLIYGV